MDSMKRVDSNLSISSVIFDCQSNDDPDFTFKTNSIIDILREAIDEVNSENAAITNESLELLNDLKVDVKYLQNNFRDSFQSTAAILKSEGLLTINKSVLQLCLEKKKMLSKMKEKEEKLLKSKYNSAFAEYNSLQEKLDRICKEVEKIEDSLQMKISDLENAESDRILWSNRLYDYKGTITKLEAELDVMYDKDVGLHKTIKKSSLLMNKINDLTQLNNNLKKYSALPPNLLQAKSVLESKKLELEEIENLIDNKMN